jgi:predicted N-acetyltransferase YhbS
MPKLRPMQAPDIPAVLAVQEESYPDELLETAEVFSARLASYPEYAWVAEEAQEACAYLFAYPARLGGIAPFNSDFARHDDADCLYLHDLAVGLLASGRGVGPALVRHALGHAKTRGLQHSALVAVQGSQDFWARMGFEACPVPDAAQADNLATYGGGSVYMTRSLA